MTKHPFMASKLSLALFSFALPAAQSYGASKTLHKRSAQSFTASSTSSTTTNTASSTHAYTITADFSTSDKTFGIFLAQPNQNALLHKRDSTHGRELPGNKYFVRSEGKTIKVMRFVGKTWQCDYDFSLTNAKVKELYVMISVDGKWVPLDKSNEKRVAANWSNCKIIASDWGIQLRECNLNELYTVLSLLKKPARSATI